MGPPSQSSSGTREIYAIDLIGLSFYTKNLVVCLSTNGERALNYTIVKLVVRSNSANAWRASRLFLQKNRTEITSNCSAQCHPFHSQLASVTKTSQLFQEESSYKLFG